MNKLILDYSKWRCGGREGIYVVGKGETALLNDEGYMCCLGQFSLQLNDKLTPSDILGNGEPQEVNKKILLLTDTVKNEYVIDEEDDGDIFVNSRLSSNAMHINDRTETTPEEKIEALKKLFAQANYEIEVINKP